MKATKQIDVYLIKKRNVRSIDVVQYDTGIQLVFTVKDFTIPSGATATLYVQKPSGKFVFQEDGITVSGNTVTIDLHNQAITEHGKAPYQVSLTSGSDVITTFTGLLLVEKSLKDAGATESETVESVKYTKTLLWENATFSPFVGQSISLNKGIADYDFFEIVYRHCPADPGCMTTGCIPTTVSTIYLTSHNDYNSTLNIRACWWYSQPDGTCVVGFGDNNNSTDGWINNGDNVPYQIYGIKGVSAQ